MTPGTAQATASIELPALPASAFWARRHAHAALGAWHIPADAADTILLLVSELVTNAITATTRPSADGRPLVTQTLRFRPGTIIIEITDDDPAPPALADAAPDAEKGRGLILVQALSKEWSWYFPPVGGKTVYAVIDTPTHRKRAAAMTTNTTTPAIALGNPAVADCRRTGMACRQDLPERERQIQRPARDVKYPPRIYGTHDDTGAGTAARPPGRKPGTAWLERDDPDICAADQSPAPDAPTEPAPPRTQGES